MEYQHVPINFSFKLSQGKKKHFILQRLFLSIFQIKRDKFHFDGYVSCDCAGISHIMTRHNYTSNVPDTVAVALHAGVDIDCGTFYNDNIPIALKNQTIVESDVDQALTHAFSVLIRLGYFDPPEQQIYRNISRVDVDTPEAQQLALLSARQSIVLLKNTNKNLPLNIDQLTNKTIALIGPSINATDLMQSNYRGRAPFLISPLMAFNEITSSILLFKLILLFYIIYF
jgi:beta-glucosidase-like glycosyl hydrolase